MTAAYRSHSNLRSAENPLVGKFTKNDAIRAELAARQGEFEHANDPALLVEINTISARLHPVAASLRGTSAPVHEQPSSPELTDPMWRQIKIQIVEAIIKARRRRDALFAPNLFADPAWDILLSLFRAELIQCRTCTTNLCVDANVPTTTALRWIKSMADDGILVRRVDPLDARRVFIELSAKTSESMTKFIVDFPPEVAGA